MEGPSIAVYLDFENLAISADTVYPSQRKPLLIEPILDYAASKGVVCLKKSICRLVKRYVFAISNPTDGTWI